MRNGRGQFDMPHTLTADARNSDFNAAFFANDTFIFHALIFTAETFVVFDRAKYTRTEQAIFLGLKRPVVDGLWLFNFAKGPAQDFLRAGERDFNTVKGRAFLRRVENVHDLLVHGIFLSFASDASINSRLKFSSIKAGLFNPCRVFRFIFF